MWFGLSVPGITGNSWNAVQKVLFLYHSLIGVKAMVFPPVAPVTLCMTSCSCKTYIWSVLFCSSVTPLWQHARCVWNTFYHKQRQQDLRPCVSWCPLVEKQQILYFQTVFITWKYRTLYFNENIHNLHTNDFIRQAVPLGWVLSSRRCEMPTLPKKAGGSGVFIFALLN